MSPHRRPRPPRPQCRPGIHRPAGADGWTQCADRRRGLRDARLRQVRYGGEGKFAYHNVDGPVGCNNAAFGDPAFGVVKRCQYAAPDTVAAGMPAHVRAASGRVLSVGPGRAYAKPCDALTTAADGDTVEIDAAGSYDGDVCAFHASDLTIRGVNGRPKIGANGRYAWGKGIWVITGKRAIVDNVELWGARVPDRNGAAIRLDGAHLTVRNSFIHDNENGILTANDGESDILIENSEFGHNGNGSGSSHNLYIGKVASLTFRYSYSHDADVGHNLKSRARINTIVYSRFSSTRPGDAGSTASGEPSYEIDLPNAGTAYLIGNVIQQPSRNQNSNLVSYGVEGASNPGQNLYVVNNTFLNDDSSNGMFILIGGDVKTPVAGAEQCLCRHRRHHRPVRRRVEGQFPFAGAGLRQPRRLRPAPGGGGGLHRQRQRARLFRQRRVAVAGGGIRACRRQEGTCVQRQVGHRRLLGELMGHGARLSLRHGLPECAGFAHSGAAILPERPTLLRIIKMRRLPTLLIAAGLLASAPLHAQVPLRDVVLVGSNWDGTAEIFDPHTFKVLKRIDIVPDRDERMKEIAESGIRRRVTFQLVRQVIGEGHDQLVDDLFPSRDGRYIYASRPSFADAVAIDVDTGKIAWRTPIEGDRADHAALSPDGKTLLVSASTARRVQAIDTATGKIVGGFDSGDQPHENNYSKDGSACLSRQHRQGVRAEHRAMAGLDQGRPLVPGRGRVDLAGAEAHRHGRKARGVRPPVDRQGGAPDGRSRRRAPGVPAGVVLPRFLRIRP